jgi:alpha-L-fucosidase 2
LKADKPGKVVFTASMQTPQKASVIVESPNTLVMQGVNGGARGIAGALKYQARVAVAASGGRIVPGDGQITVADADSALLLIAAATSYKNYKDVTGDPEALTKDAIAKASKKSFEAMLKDHTAAHRALFRRVTLDLGTTPAAQRPTDERIRDPNKVNDPQMAALYCQFGRYLLISSSRPGGQPANLQGLWNESMNPPWGSKYTININTEMNLLACRADEPWRVRRAARGDGDGSYRDRRAHGQSLLRRRRLGHPS